MRWIRRCVHPSTCPLFLPVRPFVNVQHQVKRKWAAGIENKPKFKDIRVRLVTRRDHGCAPTEEEVARIVGDKNNAYKGLIFNDEIIKAYEKGEEVWDSR